LEPFDDDRLSALSHSATRETCAAFLERKPRRTPDIQRFHRARQERHSDREAGLTIFGSVERCRRRLDDDGTSF
jgi:hypothetical protein